jgi:HEPN domain-containing protein
VSTEKSGFMAQQAGEKALKACLFAQGERRVIGHSLFELAGRLCQVDSSFQAINDEVKRLDRFYIPTRYPNGLPGGSPFQVYTEKDLLEAYDDLKKIVEISRKYLKEKKVL